MYVNRHGLGNFFDVVQNWFFDPWTYQPSTPAPAPAGATFARTDVLRELNRLQSMIQDGLARSAGTPLNARGRQLAGELARGFALSGQDPEAARRFATDLTRRVHAWLRDVGAQTTPGRQAFEETRGGASVTTQITGTFASAADALTGTVGTLPPWALPVGGAALLFLLVRR